MHLKKQKPERWSFFLSSKQLALLTNGKKILPRELEKNRAKRIFLLNQISFFTAGSSREYARQFCTLLGKINCFFEKELALLTEMERKDFMQGLAI